MTANVYDLHDKAFAKVSAYIVVKGGERVATIAFKFPKDGAGRLFAYVHWIGTEMVRGFAGGYGYDKRTAACANATRKAVTANAGDDCLSFWQALSRDTGDYWYAQLRKAGFEVWQAV